MLTRRQRRPKENPHQGRNAIPRILRRLGLRDAPLYPRVGYDVSGRGAADSRAEPWKAPEGKQIRTKRVPPKTAWKDYHWIQLNTPVRTYAITLDVDQDSWTRPGYPIFTGITPSYVLVNKETKRAQIGFFLKEPVHHGPEASLPPQRLLDHVTRELVRIAHADPAAVQRQGLFRNPVNPGPGYAGMSEHEGGGFELRELLEFVSRHPSRPGAPITPYRVSESWEAKVEASRNCRMFYVFDHYGAQHGVDDEAELQAAMEDWQELQVDARMGPFDKGPLGRQEIACIARSVAKRVRRGARTTSRRGVCRTRLAHGSCRHKGFVDGDPERDRRIVRLAAEGWTQRRIAAEVDLSQARISQVLRDHRLHHARELQHLADEGRKQAEQVVINRYTGLRSVGVRSEMTNPVTPARQRRKTSQKPLPSIEYRSQEVLAQRNTNPPNYDLLKLRADGMREGIEGLPPREGLSEEERAAYLEGYRPGREWFEREEAKRRWRDPDT